MIANNKGLGRGLDAILSDFKEEDILKEEQQKKNSSTFEIDISLIDTNPNQPRKNFDDLQLRELAESIKNFGVLQPILLLKQQNGRYVIIAGERRYRAARLAGLQSMPAIVRELTKQQVMEISLIENLQREDLNPIEAAYGLKSLLDDFGLSQEQLSKRIGMSRPNLTNTLRLLQLQPEVIEMVRAKRLSAGHARALIPVTDPEIQIQMAKKACDEKKSVRDVEMEVKLYFNRKNIQKGSREKEVQSRELKAFVNDLKRVFGTRVKIKGSDEKGRIMIDYFTPDDLQRIYEMIDFLKANLGAK